VNSIVNVVGTVGAVAFFAVDERGHGDPTELGIVERLVNDYALFEPRKAALDECPKLPAEGAQSGGAVSKGPGRIDRYKWSRVRDRLPDQSQEFVRRPDSNDEHLSGLLDFTAQAMVDVTPSGLVSPQSIPNLGRVDLDHIVGSSVPRSNYK